MKNKRKPTEILVLTDGYSFSAASLYIKYLQKQGGAVVVGYSGNSYDDSIFDGITYPGFVRLSPPFWEHAFSFDSSPTFHHMSATLER